MSVAPSSGVTQLLVAWRQGDPEALERLLPLVYRELHRLAHRRIRGEWAGQTLQTTALVNEAYVRLVDGTCISWNNRAHFFAVCARLMRRILVDRARARGSDKRGGKARHIPFEDWLRAKQPAEDSQVLALDEALGRLSLSDPRRGKVVELRYFGGLTVEETAEVLGISAETVGRDWRVARLWLRNQLRSGGATS
jgi:RNA polymerase sigma-70 factor, ECF subfamily